MMLCRRANVLPVEVIVRGYVAGSGWKDYQRTGAICGIELPAGLRESDRLPEPIFTPSTKAEVGHDENIGFDAMVELVGGRRWPSRSATSPWRSTAAAPRIAEKAGIMLADTKFELGTALDTGELILIDEVMTPDSSRFWDAAALRARPRPGQLRQAVRPRLARNPAVGQDLSGPALPAEIVAGTRERYVAAFERITGASFERYLQEDVIAP